MIDAQDTRLRVPLQLPSHAASHLRTDQWTFQQQGERLLLDKKSDQRLGARSSKGRADVSLHQSLRCRA